MSFTTRITTFDDTLVQRIPSPPTRRRAPTISDIHSSLSEFIQVSNRRYIDYTARDRVLRLKLINIETQQRRQFAETKRLLTDLSTHFSLKFASASARDQASSYSAGFAAGLKAKPDPHRCVTATLARFSQPPTPSGTSSPSITSIHPPITKSECLNSSLNSSMINNVASSDSEHNSSFDFSEQHQRPYDHSIQPSQHQYTPSFQSGFFSSTDSSPSNSGYRPYGCDQ